MIKVSVCLSDIPKSKINKSKNGKSYIDLMLAERKTEGKYGETHTLFISQTKEERESDEDTIYVGSGKIVGKADKPQVNPKKEDKGINADQDNLPF